MYRESAFNPDCDDPNVTELIVNTNRHGGMGTALLEMKGGYFEDVVAPEFIPGNGDYNPNKKNDDDWDGF